LAILVHHSQRKTRDRKVVAAAVVRTVCADPGARARWPGQGHGMADGAATAVGLDGAHGRRAM